MSTCERCNGSGFEDSGGVQPWGEPILVECECRLMERNMDDRYEIADQNGMSREFSDWFFDNKKDGCGNVWFLMMAAMWEGWKESRAAVEIELPEVCAWNLCELLDKKEVIESIRAAGIKVKECV